MKFKIVLILFAALLILPVIGIGSAQAEADEKCPMQVRAAETLCRPQ